MRTVGTREFYLLPSLSETNEVAANKLHCRLPGGSGRILLETLTPFAYGRAIPGRRGEASRKRFAEGLGGNTRASRAVKVAALGEEP